MNFIKCEKLEKSMAELQFSVDAEAFKAAVADVFKKEGKKYAVPGFRKGKAPRALIEKMYGADVFTYDAINELFPEAYEAAVKEAGVEPVGRPEVTVDSASETEGATLTVKVAVKPEVKVGNYSGLTVEKTVHTVTDEAVDAELKRVQERNARELTREGAAQNGDITDIDFEGFVDGVAFDGGKAEHYSLTLGSGSFIPGFEDQIVGHSAGEEFDVNVTFPADYGKEDLAGKPAVFKIVLHELKKNEIPELDDEFVKEVSEKSNTVAEYKEEIKAKITERKDKANERAMEEKLIDALNAVTEVDIPEAMIDAEVDNEVRDYAYRLQSQGGSLEMYFQYTGMDEKGLRDSLRPGAERQVKTRLALEAIVKTENITPTDEEIEEEYRKIASGYTVDIEKVKASIPVESLSEDIVLRKAVDLVKENAKITVAVPEEAPKAAKKTRAKKAETADGEEKTEAKPKRTKKAAEPKAEDKAE